MIKRSISLILVLVLALSIIGCGKSCEHEWTEADCAQPRTCSLCGETEGEPLGHDWQGADCENPESCRRCGETQGEALGHSYGQWLLDAEEMYRICSNCEQTEETEIDYALYLEQHIYGRWNLCSMVQRGRYLDSYMLPQDEVDPEYCFYEDGRVSSMGFEEKEISQSWSFDHGEYDSESGQHFIYISFTENNELSAARFTCIGDEVYYEVPLDDEGDVVTLSNSFGDAVGKALVGTWSTWSQGSIYNISFSEDRSFTADIDGEISGFWQPRQPNAFYDGGYTSDLSLMLNYYKDGKACSQYAQLFNFNPNLSPERKNDFMILGTYVKDNYTQFSFDTEQFLTEALATADTAHLGTWTSTEYTISTQSIQMDKDDVNVEVDEDNGLSTGYSITFMEDGSFSAKLDKEFEGQWTLQEINRDNGGASLKYQLTAPGISEYSYFQMNENGYAYAYIGYLDYSSANYRFAQMSDEEIAARNELAAAAPNMVVGEWFSTDGQDFKAVFNEDGTFTISSDTAPAQYNYNGYWYFNTMNDYQGEYTSYIYDIETIMETADIGGLGDAMGMDFGDAMDMDFGIDMDAAVFGASMYTADAGNAEDAEPATYREDYALYLKVKDGLYTLEMSSIYVSGTMTNAEGLAMVEDAASTIVGHWSADSATEYDIESQQGTDVSVDFYLDIAEDGSLTGYLGKDVQGSWRFFEIGDGDIRYLFTISGASMDSLFTLKDEVLSGYYEPYIMNFSK